MRRSLLLILCIFLLASCYNQGPITPDAWNLTEQQLDSISFYTTHHYSQGYNFVVKKDSLVVLEQQNEMMPIPDILTLEITTGEETMPMLSLVDSIILRKHDHLVVADIRTVATDSIDSVGCESLCSSRLYRPMILSVSSLIFSRILICCSSLLSVPLYLAPMGFVICCVRGRRLSILTIFPHSILHCFVCSWQHQQCCIALSSFLRLRCGGISITIRH